MIRKFGIKWELEVRTKIGPERYSRELNSSKNLPRNSLERLRSARERLEYFSDQKIWTKIRTRTFWPKFIPEKCSGGPRFFKTPPSIL